MRASRPDRAWLRGHETDPDVPARGRPGAAAAKRADTSIRTLVAEMLQEIRLLRQTTTEEAGKLRGQLVNNVLEVGTYTIAADGILARSYNVPCGSVAVINLGTAEVTVTSSPPGPAAPAGGAGVTIVPASSWLSVPIGTRNITIYGTVGARVGLQAFTGMQAGGAR